MTMSLLDPDWKHVSELYLILFCNLKVLKTILCYFTPMGNTVLRDVIVIAGITTAFALAVANKEKIYDMAGLTPAPAPVETVQVETPKPPQVKRLNGSVVSIPKSQRDGQFWTDARVNNGHVKFLVDTGASAVALTLNDAKKAGIRTRELNYNVPISTAGGRNMAAYVDLKSISVGAITLRNVRALVVPEGLHTSLLGMTYLGQLQKVEATPNALLLRL